MYPILTSALETDSLNVRAAKNLNSLHCLIHSGEEPIEISCEVDKAAKSVAEGFVAWAEERAIKVPAPALSMIAEGYIRYVYLCVYGDIYPKSVSVFRFGKHNDRKFAEQLADELEVQDKTFITIMELHTQYLRLYFKELKKATKDFFEPFMARCTPTSPQKRASV